MNVNYNFLVKIFSELTPDQKNNLENPKPDAEA